MTNNTGKHRKQSAVVKNIAKVGVAAAIVGIPAVATAAPAGATNWDAVAHCESSGNWNTNTGNGFSGGLQFTPSTWKANGGTGSPQNASRAQQIKVAEKVKSSQGMGAWPVCGAKGGSGSSSASGSTQSSGSATQSSSNDTQSQTQSLPKETSTVKIGDGNYTVKSGDTLGKIAKEKHVSGGWSKLYTLNKSILNDANSLFPGQKLHTS